MSEIKCNEIRRIFYFNITYGCNSNCIYCYSHNTYHNSVSYKEIELNEFLNYIDDNNISKKDRVIINGGEPLLYSNIIELLDVIKKYDFEKLIYTNGRLLSKLDLTELDSSYRFVVPIHGDEITHDYITGVAGSYKETIEGLNSFRKGTRCKLDIKIILNSEMIKDTDSLNKTLNSFDNVYFNNAVHLTKMADTVVSKKNNCISLSNEVVSTCMEEIFNYFLQKECRIKVFDTCIKTFEWLNSYSLEKMKDNFEVFFKDINQERELCLERNTLDCMKTCDKVNYCISAVDEYKVLEFYDSKLFENWE
ncbi:MAG: radical SAM protein [Paraclostridium sp.]